jgi:dienelactone hydrolase
MLTLLLLLLAPVQETPAQVREAFVKLLDRPKVALDPQARETKTEGGFLTELLSIASEKTERVPILLVRPAKLEARAPAVVVLHGTGGNKESQRAWLEKLARKGMIGVAIDARYHGERVPGVKGAAAYNEAVTRAWRARPGEPQEHPFYFDTAWDLWRVIDWLETRPDVDPSRLGMIGFSMGGIQTWLAAAADERVKVSVPAIGVQSFRWSLENERWQARARTIAAAHDAAAKDLGETTVNARVCRELWNKVSPGILDRFDGPSMIRLFAGRPLLVLNGEKDPNCPIEGARLAFAAAEEAFRAAGCPERLKIDVAPGVAHQVTKEQHDLALDWFERWLR